VQAKTIVSDSNETTVSVRQRIEALRSVARTRIGMILRRRQPGILHVLHGRRGGTDKYVRELVAATRDEYRHYLLVTSHDHWQLFDMTGDTPSTYDFRSHRADALGDWLGSLCSRLGVGLIHVHSLVDTGELPALLERTAVPYCYTVWDMHLPCPTVLLIDSAGVYCNATTDPATCNRCLAKFDHLKHIEIVAWRGQFEAFLGRAARVFAPSRWAGETLAKYFPDLRFEFSPPRPVHAPDVHVFHPSHAFDLPDDGFRHVGVLGAVGPEKGARHVEALAQRIRDRRLPLRIVVVGYMDLMKRDQSADRVLTVHGHYDESEVTTLLDRYRVSMLVFPTIWPETFSYTLSEGWNAGRPALVPPVGALQERVIASGAGWVMRGWPDTDATLDQLMELTAPENAPELERRAGLGRATAVAEAAAHEPMRDYYPAMLARSSTLRASPLPLSRMFRAALQSAAIAPAGARQLSPSSDRPT
jgi:glycosyltransferase involved in cell wall biosynthesis